MKPPSRSPWRHLPNALTILRLLMAAPIALLVLAGDSALALALFIAAGATDAIDGWLAKHFGWQSQLGGWLDPLADKALVLAVCLALALRGDLPYWLFGVIAIRDLVIVSGAVAFHFNFAPLQAAPTLVGKLTTLILLSFVVILLWRNVSDVVPVWLVHTMVYLSVAMLVASGVDYVRRWSAKARKVSRQKSIDPEHRP
jgi:cardiolipin synthase